jgi:hypothetical protein
MPIGNRLLKAVKLSLVGAKHQFSNLFLNVALIIFNLQTLELLTPQYSFYLLLLNIKLLLSRGLFTHDLSLIFLLYFDFSRNSIDC